MTELKESLYNKIKTYIDNTFYNSAPRDVLDLYCIYKIENSIRFDYKEICTLVINIYDKKINDITILEDAAKELQKELNGYAEDTENTSYYLIQTNRLDLDYIEEEINRRELRFNVQYYDRSIIERS